MKSQKSLFWDYHLNKSNFNDPRVKLWYLTRQLRFGNLTGLTKKELKKYLPKLNINPSLKELLQNYLRTHG